MSTSNELFNSKSNIVTSQPAGHTVSLDSMDNKSHHLSQPGDQDLGQVLVVHAEQQERSAVFQLL